MFKITRCQKLTSFHIIIWFINTEKFERAEYQLNKVNISIYGTLTSNGKIFGCVDKKDKRSSRDVCLLNQEGRNENNKKTGISIIL